MNQPDNILPAPDGATSPTDYLLRVAADEIDFMEREFFLQSLPHVGAFIRHPVGRFLLGHIQNVCWTAARARQRFLPHAPSPHLASTPSGARVRRDAAPRDLPKIWIDITNTYRHGPAGGIGRVAKHLAKAAWETGLALPVVIEHGGIYEFFDRPNEDGPLRFDAETIYVVVDTFWQQVEDYRQICATAKAAGAKVVTCIHDVAPLTVPSFDRLAFVEGFSRSFAAMIELSDACITISDTTRRDVARAIGDLGLRQGRPLPMASFRLGANGVADIDDVGVRDAVRRLFASPNVFLSVGTLEPRKGYAVTLDAFDGLWARGVACELVILGREGWVSRSLERRIREHPAFGKTLHWIEDARDCELAHAYRAAHCLIQASITEGFGLPIVEATREGTPVIATDLDVFRELAGDEIVYFRPCDSDDLAAKIEAAITHRPAAAKLDLLRWDESLARMVACVTAALEPSPA